MSGDLLGSLLPLIVLFAIFYFLIIRPQQQSAKKHKQMIEDLKKGDKIVTSGGLIAEVVKVEDEFFRIKLSDNVEVRLVKEYVVRLLNEETK
ncbi:MAG: preprotein translocase subunit YajC [Arcobacteraceae bacterium]|jgi:preprotein translocase subunit YajC|nr:preprotein translocase subunit YajC [Arcobacteraceae bacterium]MDY0364964.1 preprotein translocase subunit YajC [Arcobacteraceae bacterium]